MTLRKNLQAGLPVEEAFVFRRKPGRHFTTATEDVMTRITEVPDAMKLLREGAELWVYSASGVSRISLILGEQRHTIGVELFEALLYEGLIEKTFETDTIRNFELTEKGRADAA